MNKTDQLKNDKYVDYWKPAGIDSVAENDKLKVEKEVGKYAIKVNPTIYNTKVIIPTVYSTKVKTENKELTPKKPKAERFQDIPYSTKHNDLIAGLHMSKNILKQQAQKAAHEKKITDMIYKLRSYRLEREKRYKTNKPNLLVVQRKNSKGLPYDYRLIPSSKKTSELIKVAKEMNQKLSKSIDDYFGITVWHTKDYLLDRIKNTPILILLAS